MPDYYHSPALILTALLLPAFGYLFLRSRNIRALLWFLGFVFVMMQMLLHYKVGWWDLEAESHPWVMAASLSCGLLGSALFCGSLSPARFRVGKVEVLYVIPFALPLLAYVLLYVGVFHSVAPSGPVFLIFPALGAFSLIAGLFWSRAKGPLPNWIWTAACLLFGGLAMWTRIEAGPTQSIVIIGTGFHFVTALLLVFVYRRISPGVILSVMGFAAWSLSSLELVPSISANSSLDLTLIHIIVMGKVVAAIGMILVALEDELAINKAAQDRERRARREMEAYSNLILSRRRVEDFDRQGPEICQTVVANSRFDKAALLLLSSTGRYHLAGAAGLDAATTTALGALAERIPVEGFLAAGSAPDAVEHSQTLKLDLKPWLVPGDDLKRLRLTSVLAVPLTGRSATEGALLLAGMHDPKGHSELPLRHDDLLPVEMLTARLQAVRGQTMMLEKLIDSEKFAGLGQLAGNVTQELNNPLTVILGYGSLLEDAQDLDPRERRGVEAILTEARRMKSTLESLSRISRTQSGQLAAVSVTELLADLEQLYRADFLHRSIEFQINMAPDLPRVLCNAQQLRQAVLHCLQFALEVVEKPQPNSYENEAKTVRLEATAEGDHVKIVIAHSGAGFLDPDRAFDPFVPAQAASQTAGLGLSLCATILRDHKGRASAVNLAPTGAAIILELQTA